MKAELRRLASAIINKLQVYKFGNEMKIYREFQAAANPAAILSLLDELDAARAVIIAAEAYAERDESMKDNFVKYYNLKLALKAWKEMGK